MKPGDDAAAPLRVSAGGRPALTLTAEGAAAAPWELAEGNGVARNVYPKTDVVATASAERLEFFLVLRDASAPRSFDYRLQLEAGYRLLPMPVANGFVIENQGGEATLQIPPAFAVDSVGTRRPVMLTQEDTHLRVGVDTTGLRFPVLVDPVLESALWQLLSPAAKPSPRHQLALAYDAFRSKVVLFGGLDSGDNHVGDTYTWDGTTWTPACAEGAGCANGIPGRSLHAMAYDSANHLTMVFGGEDSGGLTLNDLWAWNGASWSSKTTGPTKRLSTAMAYDSARSRLVVFGGFDSSTGGKGDLWEFDGATWAQRCSTAADPCFTDAKPDARYAHRMAFDAARSVTVLFGGFDAIKAADASDTWAWNGSHWLKKCDPCTTARQPEVMVYDSTRQRIVMYGGHQSGVAQPLSDTLEWDGTSWATTLASGGPGKNGTGSAHDAAHGRVVVFGGDHGPAGAVTDDTTWVYHSRGAQCTLDTQCDTGNCVDGVCCETPCNAACQRCDQDPTPGVCSTFVSGTDAECTGYCDGAGACQAKLAAGTACTTTFQCQAGACSSVDHVCCNSDCAGLCESCLAAKTGAAAGTCSPVKIATDPDVECPDDGAASCDRNGLCDGARACQLYAANTQCVAQSCSGTTLSAADTCNGTGTCVDKGTSSCATGYKCNTGGTACNPTCATDNECVAGYFCLGTACTLKRPTAAACTAGNQCANGFCSDLFCCNVACGAACDVCAASLGAPANGTCGVANQGVSTTQCAKPLACDGVSTACAAPGACATDTDCAAGYYCKGDGTCSPQVPQGGTCDATVGANGCKTGGCRVCGSAGGCVGGVCCNTACGGACDVCTVATIGVCTIVAKGAASCGGYKCDGASAACPATCASSADCVAGSYCDASSHCITKKGQGQACSLADECTNGQCVDNFCCNSACTNKCDACAAAFKESAKDDGVCGSARSGSDPHDDCAATAPSSCGTTGNCDGAGACALHANTACGATSCVSGTAFIGQACDGFGNCKNQQTQQDCTPYVCSTTTNACANPCQADQDCQNPTQHRCVSGACVAKLTPGSGCTVGAECLSGNCVDGVCCDDACQGQCQYCADIANLGHCVTLASGPPKMAGSTTRTACAGADTCQGECKGVAGACTYPSAATTCGAASCVGNSLQPAATCDGAGLCGTPTKTDCGDYACDGTAGACKTTCVTSADCTGGGVCITADHRCTTAGATCDGDYAVKATDGTVSSCNGYRCIANACQQQCATSLDCAPGYQCGAGHCVASSDSGVVGAGGTPTGGGTGGRGASGTPATERDGSVTGSGGSTSISPDAGIVKPLAVSGDKGGCGCRTAATSNGERAPLALLFAFGTLLRIRRRTASRRSGTSR